MSKTKKENKKCVFEDDEFWDDIKTLKITSNNISTYNNNNKYLKKKKIKQNNSILLKSSEIKKNNNKKNSISLNKNKQNNKNKNTILKPIIIKNYNNDDKNKEYNFIPETNKNYKITKYIYLNNNKNIYDRNLLWLNYIRIKKSRIREKEYIKKNNFSFKPIINNNINLNNIFNNNSNFLIKNYYYKTQRKKNNSKTTSNINSSRNISNSTRIKSYRSSKLNLSMINSNNNYIRDLSQQNKKSKKIYQNYSIDFGYNNYDLNIKLLHEELQKTGSNDKL